MTPVDGSGLKAIVCGVYAVAVVARRNPANVLSAANEAARVPGEDCANSAAASNSMPLEGARRALDRGRELIVGLSWDQLKARNYMVTFTQRARRKGDS